MFSSKSIFCLSLFCALAASLNIGWWSAELSLSFSTLKSDLDLILADPDKPRTVNIEYTEGAVLHVKLFTKPFSPLGQRSPITYAQIDGKINIKYEDGPIQEENNVALVNGSFLDSSDGGTLFTRPSEQEKTTYIIIKPNSGVEPKPADKTISYISTTVLTKGLNSKEREMKKKRIKNKDTVTNSISLGSFSTPLTYNFENRALHLDKFLKGISLSPNVTPPNIFIDVWYQPHSQQYGSSGRSFEGIDAVRVYDEWYRHETETASDEETLTAGREGEQIRRQIFKQDMKDTLQRLHFEQSRYTNAFLIYGSNIVLEAQRREDGPKKLVWAIGTTMADARGRGRTNVLALYDGHKADYSRRLQSDVEFIPTTYGNGSYFLMYTALEKFQSHLKAVSAAMKGRCDTKNQIYHFSIFYGESIKVKYYCDTGNIVMEDNHKFIMRSVSTSGTLISNECHYLRYTKTHRMEIKCTDDDATPIAIRQEPRQLWFNDGAPKFIKTAFLSDEMELMKEILIENGKTPKQKPTLGTSTLDGNMLFEMHLPKDEKHSRYVKVYGQFEVRTSGTDTVYRKLHFHGPEYAAPGNTGNIPLTDIFTSLHFDSLGFSKSMFVIGSAFLTTKQLQENLQVASVSASTRCRVGKIKTSSLKLVHQSQFALDGFYDCSERVFLFKGNFSALLLSKKGSDTEILTQRPINNFIYVVKDKLFIPDTESFDDVYAIRLPKMVVDFEEILKNFGSPRNEKLPQHTQIMYKFEEL